MTAPSATTLPPEGSSAAAARRLVEAAIADTALGALLDEALLLVTELVTNAIVHAGTDVELEVDSGAEGLRVEVADHSPGVIGGVRHSPDEAREGGRGLFLLDALATEWGTRHFPQGKAVWFVLAPDSRRPEPHLAPSSRQTTQAARRDISWLLGLPSELEQQLSPAQLISELLHRLAEGLGIEQCWVFAHAADDDRRWELVATNDPAAAVPEVDRVRRAVHAKAAGLPDDDLDLLPLQSAAGVYGVLVLRNGADLDREDHALARLVAERIGVIVRDDWARATQLRSRGSLALLAEASEMFAGTLDVQLGMTLATQLVVPRFARWSAVWATHDRMPRLMAVAHADEERLDALQKALSAPDGDRLGRRLARNLVERRPNLLPGSELPTELSEERSGEVLALPLVARRRLLGVLVVGRPAGGTFGADDVGLLNDLARRTAVAVDSARMYEESTSIAQALQASLLPPTLPQSTLLEFGARYAAAGEGNEVGGDFYDVFELTGSGWGLAIGDVCGKGAEAAAITGMARDVLRLLVRDGAPPAVALRRLNGAILDLGDRGRFCTAMLGTVQPEGDGLRVTMSSAGHPAPVLLRRDGDVSFVGRSGTLLGVLDDLDLAEDVVELAPGDALVFYTDGVTERRDGAAMFGEYNLVACLRTAGDRAADAIAGLLEEHVQGFGTARDDLAVLVVRCTGLPGGKPDTAPVLNTAAI